MGFENWLISMRGELMTDVFALFPILVHEYFVISVLALCFWLNPSSRLMQSFGFLIPFSTLCNCLLKNIFRVLRPDESMFLVNVYDPYGFPSGDVQSAMVFCAACWMSSRHKSLRYLWIVPVVSIAISRMYLGVHSLYDVLFAMIVGLVIVVVWHYQLKDKILSGSRCVYWSLLVTLLLCYVFFSYDLEMPPMLPISLGACVGVGLSLKYMDRPVFEGISCFGSALWWVPTLLVASMVHVNQAGLGVREAVISIKFAVVVFMIYALVPRLHSRMRSINAY